MQNVNLLQEPAEGQRPSAVATAGTVGNAHHSGDLELGGGQGTLPSRSSNKVQ